MTPRHGRPAEQATPRRGKLPASASEWDEETRSLAYQVMGVGLRWQAAEEERKALSALRLDLYRQLRERGVSARAIGELTSTTKSAVEQVLIAPRRRKNPA